jgi:hypothetical protein
MGNWKRGEKGMKKGMKISTVNNPNEYLNICYTQQTQLMEDWCEHQIQGGNKSSLQFPDSHLPSLGNQNALEK